MSALPTPRPPQTVPSPTPTGTAPVSFQAIAPTNPAASAYLRTRVLTASPQELRLMLLDGAIKFASQGREGLAAKNFEAAFTGFNQAREIIMELMTSIRPEPNPQLAQQVKAIYAFIYSQLVEGELEKDMAKLNSALELLAYERETWVLLMEKLRNEQATTDPVVQAPTAPQSSAPARPALSVQG